MIRWLLIAAVACGPHPQPTPPNPNPAPNPVGGPVPVDAPEPSQEERLAAIQKAMNELDEAAQGCWAAAAVDRFDIAGELVAMIDIQGAGVAKASIVRDTTRTPKLASCVVAVLSKYLWAPPLYGQTIQLPFKFRAPDGQNVIDRGLVPWVPQGKLAVATLLDEHNSGNAGASLLELAIGAGGSTGARVAERAELWYFLAPATVDGKPVDTGAMMFVPAGTARDVASAAGAHAVIAIVPGGREGAARAGALPTREGKGSGAPILLPAKTARFYCLAPAPYAARECKPAEAQVAIYAEPATIRGTQLAASLLVMPAGYKVPEHVHAGETELLYMLAGTGTLTVAGVAQQVTATSVVQIPPNTKHAFEATADLRALQIYTPAGPEQRFKPKSKP